MELTDADLDHIADLARLELAADGREALRSDLVRLLDYVTMLQGADVEGVEPMVSPTDLHDVLRDDVARPAGPVRLDSLAPEMLDGRVKVPRTVDQDG